MRLTAPALFFIVVSLGLTKGVAFGQTSITDSVSMPVNSSQVTLNATYTEAMKAKLHRDTRKAIQYFEEFTALSKTEAAPYYELAKLYDENKNTEKAAENIKKAVALAGDNKWYNEFYASILAKQGKYEEAGKVIAAIAEIERTNPDYPTQAAEYFDRARNFPLALQQIDKAIMRSGDDEDVILRKVQIYQHMDNLDKAAEVLKTLIATDPKNAKYYKYLGDFYDNNKQPDKAIKVFLDAEKKMPGEPAIEIGLSEHYLRVGDTVNFRKYAKKTITNEMLDAETQMQLFFSYIQGMNDSVQLTEGMPLLEQLLAQQPKNPQLLAIYGEFLETARQPLKAAAEYKKSLIMKPASFAVWKDLLSLYAFSEAKNADSLIRYSEKALRLFPNQSLAHYFNGLGHYNKKEFPLAIKAVERAVDIIPENDIRTLSAMYSFLGEVYNTTKQYELSDKYFDKALKLDPEDATVLNNFSYFLSERGKDLERAKSMSAKALKLRPNEGTFMDTYGWILYKTGDYEHAKDYIEKAVNLAGKRADGTLYDHLGDIYYKLNDKAKAVQFWKTAKEKGSENPNLTRKISDEKLYE